MKFETEMKYAKEIELNRLTQLTKIFNNVKIREETKTQLAMEIYATEQVIKMIEELELRFDILMPI